MKEVLENSWKIGLSILFGIVVFLFWGSCYPAHLSYQEQFQLFLTGSDYWWERTAVPGGVADYIAEYLTQFFYHRWTGACILGILYVLLQRLIWKLAKAQGADEVYYPLSFLPVIGLWYFMGDENAMLSYAVALLVVLFAAGTYIDLRWKWNRIAYVLIVLPLLYWVAGSVHFLFMGWLIIREILASIRNKNLWEGFGVLLGAGLLGVGCPLLSSMDLQYPMSRLMFGINYYRLAEIVPWIVVAIVALLILYPFVLSSLPKLKKNLLLCGVLQTLVLAVGGCYFVSAGCDMDKEEAMEYDYLVRNKQWEKIIEKAEKNEPESPFCIACLNLALGKTGQLGDRMFEFNQRGMEGLIPAFRRDCTSPLLTGEIFYHIGMLNAAQQYTFEAMEAIPNYRKSARCLKRLAEINLINGQYEVAAKYLRKLKKALFYRRWAEKTMTCLYNEEKINAHEEWGWLRQARYQEDFLFSEGEMDVMLGLLFQHDRRNKLAFEYLLGSVMLRGDLEHFMKYYPLSKYADYDHVPRSYQEALIYVWLQTHTNFSGIPWTLSAQVLQDAAEFAGLYHSRSGNMDAMLKNRFGMTYWYYLYNRQKK